MNCSSLIQSGISPNCADPLKKGIERRGWIINRSDVNFGAIKYNAIGGNVIETLPLNSNGKGAFEIVQLGKTPFAGTKSTIELGTYMNTVTHEIGLVILNKGHKCADFVKGLMNGSFVVILENKHKSLKDTNPGHSAFQVYGIEQGLELASGESDKWSDDTRSGWFVTLKEEQAMEPELYLFKTDYQTTLTAIETMEA